MTHEEYEEHLLGAQGASLGHAPEEVEQKPVFDRRLAVAPIPHSMNGNDAMRRPWGYVE